jgi:membrane-bound serine protease (ClpP class)
MELLAGYIPASAAHLAPTVLAETDTVAMPNLRAIAAAAALTLSALIAAAQAVPSPLVVIAEYDGVIHPIAAEFLDDAISRADALDAAALVLILRTPGGLLESTRSMVSSMIASPVPVVVYIAPSGSRAASAGFILALAADVAAMAPGTHIGAAHPVGASGDTEKNASLDKAVSDTAAYARTLAAARARNVALAADAVIESRAFTEREAREAEPPLIDVIAEDVDALLRHLDGRDVRRFNGAVVTVRTAGATLEPVTMTRRQQVLSAIAHPQIAYLLLSLGMLGLVVELWNPGALIPGIAGGICLMLAFFAFQILPVDVAGLLLLVLGISLLILEATVPSFGMLGVGGIVAVVAGSIMITDDIPGLRVDLRVIVAVAIAAGLIAIGLGRLALRAQRLAPATGASAMIGEIGSALTALSPAAAGQVRLHGEIWRARSYTPVQPGGRVRVQSLDGLTLEVEPVAEPSPEEADHAV